jgi:TetR/AcrR family transcriptional repressor of nem operon
MARPKEFDQEKALRKAIGLFSQQGFAATSTDDLMRVMEVGRQSMYDTFGDKRALFLKALELYVTESVHSINVELERPGSALAAVQNALVTFAQRKDLVQRRRLHGAQRHQRIRSARCRRNAYHT